jgi:hypothetical protein
MGTTTPGITATGIKAFEMAVTGIRVTGTLVQSRLLWPLLICLRIKTLRLHPDDPKSTDPKSSANLIIMIDKEWAMELVKQFDERGQSGVWTHIQREDLVNSLRNRLNDPDSLNQGNTNLCGVASFLRDWLQDDPIGYVWLAICLFERGTGSLSRRGNGGRVIRPSQELKSSVLADKVDPADWIVMASLRDDMNLSLNYRADEGWLFWSDIRGLTSVGEVVKLFRRAGYQDVRDYANWWARYSASHLEMAGRYVLAGYKVVLFIDGRLLKKAKQDTEALVATANHFVGLISSITFDPSREYLDFNVFSWGKVRPVQEGGGWMPVKTLERHYYGFVAVKF